MPNKSDLFDNFLSFYLIQSRNVLCDEINFITLETKFKEENNNTIHLTTAFLVSLVGKFFNRERSL